MREILRPTAFKRVIFFIFFDILISLFTLYLSYLLRFNFNIPPQFLQSYWMIFFTLTFVKILVFFAFKLYFLVWRFFSLEDSKKIVKAHIIAYAIFTVIYLIFEKYFLPFPRSVIIIDFFLSLVFIGVFRVSRRMLQSYTRGYQDEPTLIIGISNKTNLVIQGALRGEIPYYPVAIVALIKDKENIGSYINNIKVYSLESLESLVEEYSIKNAIISKDISSKELKKVVDKLNSFGVKKIKKIDIIGDEENKLEDISIEDLLARKPKDLDKEVIENFIKDRVILITGAGGSIGSELVRQCVKYGAKRLILVEHSEYNLYKIEQELEGKADIVPVMQSVVNKELLLETFKEYKPEIVIHAAAYKHVPLVEWNIQEAILNNIIGTKNTIDCAIISGAKKVILISTDKAVRPTNVMGTTKRVCELYAQNVKSEVTEIVAVRFGNVLGSSGSVVPKFKEQIEQGGPVTVTHPDITRYFMLIPEASELVLQAASIGKGGEIFILDMGEPVKIVDLAKKMIELSGKDGIKITFTSLRPGEKLYEELLIDDSDKNTKYKSIFVATPTKYDIVKLNQDIEELLKAEDKIGKLKEIVPEFNHKSLRSS